MLSAVGLKKSFRGRTVVRDFDFRLAISRLKRHTSLNDGQIRNFFMTTPLWDAFECGQLTPTAFFGELRKQLHLKNLSFSEFETMWNDIFTEKLDTVEFLRQIRGRYRTALVSNVNVMHWEFVWKRHGFLKWFDYPIASYQVGTRKPGTEIYRIALQRAGVSPQRAAFVDDVESHIHAARSIGIHAVHFISAEQLRRDWEHLLEEGDGGMGGRG